jgi:hypothetical protein
LTPRGLPPELSMDVSRAAVVLYFYILSFCDETGFCSSVFEAACWANLEKEERKTAFEELRDAGYVLEYRDRVPIAEFRGGVVMGSKLGCQVVNYCVPLDFERLSPITWKKLREAVFKRDDYTCQYCDERGGELECDHVLPISRGGTNEMGNLVTACASCNRAKRTRLLSEWRGRVPV